MCTGSYSWRLSGIQAGMALSEQAQRVAFIMFLRPRLAGLSRRFGTDLLFGQIEVDGVGEETGGEGWSVSWLSQVVRSFPQATGVRMGSLGLDLQRRNEDGHGCGVSKL